jgi:DHA3 family macrolide efflux protein-like MFS transporter
MGIDWKKNTALFLGGQALTVFGSAVVQYAILWHITLNTRSGVMMTVFTIAGLLPVFFISPFAGVWADRFNRKYLINIADAVIAFVSLVVAVFLFFGFDHVGILLFCAVIRSFGQGVQAPAVGAFIPQIVPQEHLTRVNGIQGSIQSASMLAAPVVSGVLMSFAPLETLFLVDVVTAAMGISILFFLIKVPASPLAGEGSGSLEEPSGSLQESAAHKGVDYFRDLKEGLKYIRGHGFIFHLIIISSFFFIAVSPLLCTIF